MFASVIFHEKTGALSPTTTVGPQQIIYLIKNPFKQRNKMTIINRRTNNSNTAYVRNEFENRKPLLESKRKRHLGRKRKAIIAVPFKLLKLPAHQRVNAALQAACTEGGSIDKLWFSSPAPEAEQQ